MASAIRSVGEADRLRLSIRQAALEAPQHEFIVTRDSVLTYREAARRVAFLVERLQLDALPEGTRDTVPVALEGTATLNQLLASSALLEAGVPFVVLHPRWVERELEEVLEQCGVAKVLTMQMVEQVLQSFDPTTDHELTPRQPPWESTQTVVFTSGTSGRPKGVRLSRRALTAAAAASAERLGWMQDDRWMLNLPMAHVGGLSVLTRVLAGRRTLVLGDGGRFEASRLVEEIETLGVTLVSLVPTMLQRIVQEGIACPQRLRVALIGGARAAKPLLVAARALGWPCSTTYGMTEMSSQVATQPPVQAAEQPAGLLPLAGVEVRLVDRHGAATTDEAGLIEVRGDNLFSGYLGEPVRGPESWFATGDSGRWSGDGLQILDRQGDLLISGGENVSPVEVEALLEEHPAVEQACVVGLDDAEWGQVIAAVLVSHDGATAAPADFDDFVCTRLASYKRPRRQLWLSALPETAGGKLDRAACRRLLAQSSVSELESS